MSDDILEMARTFRRELDQNFDDLKKRVTLLEMASEQRRFHELRSYVLTVETVVAEIERVANRNRAKLVSEEWMQAVASIKFELIDAIKAKAGMS